MQNIRHLLRIPTGISYLLHRDRVWGQPIFFTIETINTCNFRCVYCPQSDPDNHFINGRGLMSLENFKRIIANLRSAFDLDIVSLHRDGEPLLNKNLEAYIRHLADLGTCVTISTNASLISEERAKSLIASGLRMAGTDFCADGQLYEQLRVRGDWNKVLAGINNLLRAAEDAKVEFRFVIKDLGAYNASPEAAKLSIERTRALFAHAEGRVTVMPVQFHNALGQSLVNLSGTSSVGPRAYTVCHQPWVNLTVDFAGRVVGCCRDLRSEFVLGNLLEEPAEAIWNGERAMELRRALAAKRPEQICICNDCDAPWQGSYSGRTASQKIGNFLFASAWRR